MVLDNAATSRKSYNYAMYIRWKSITLVLSFKF